jgi:signal transduction histidine kinase
MKRLFGRFVHDTIRGRIALTILVAVVMIVALNGLLLFIRRDWTHPPMEQFGMGRRIATIIRMIDAAPPADRPALIRAATAPPYTVYWFATAPVDLPLPPSEVEPRELGEWLGEHIPNDPRHMVVLNGLSPAARIPPLSDIVPPDKSLRILAMPLRDGSWLAFIGKDTPHWGPGPWVGLGSLVLCVLFSVRLVSYWSTRWLSRPIDNFVDAAHRFGTDPLAPPIALSGPAEVRHALLAFNRMQERIQRFVRDRTEMLAAISHDLRTPLTRMRLRTEFMDDPEQQAGMLSEIEEMETMIAATLAFARDDARNEPATAVDLAALIQDLLDHAMDRGATASFSGPHQAAIFGRPVALRRAMANLVDNAIKYGTSVEVALAVVDSAVHITVRDHGPGIPAELREKVFAPFFRIESSRNRNTGGSGLGLSVVRSVVHAHGGDIRLDDAVGGGLLVEVILPMPAQPATLPAADTPIALPIAST